MNWLREFLTGRYVRMLEEECARLRVENRALLNTLLGRMGFEPVESAASPAGPPQIRRSGLSWHQLQRKTERESLAKMAERGRAERAAKEPNFDPDGSNMAQAEGGK